MPHEKTLTRDNIANLVKPYSASWSLVGSDDLLTISDDVNDLHADIRITERDYSRSADDFNLVIVEPAKAAIKNAVG